MLWSGLRRLRAQGLHFRRQVPIAGMVVDFACHGRRLVVELDGSGHGERAQAEADALRDARLAELGYAVRRISNGAVRRDLAAVVDGVHREAAARPQRRAVRRAEA